MYKKLFESMYNGSLVTKGPWEALVTFQQMIILADQFGVVDITPEVMARRTGIPLTIIQTGIDALSEPDPDSRNPELDGRRIDLLDDHRKWGWRIVNFAYYDSLRRADERAAYQAQKYQERKSVKSRKSTTSKKVSTDSTPVNNSTLSTPHSHSHSHSELHSQSEHQTHKREKSKSAHAWPKGFTLTAERQAKAELYWKGKNVERNAQMSWDAFASHHQAKGNTFSNWEKAWEKWYVGDVTMGKEHVEYI